MTPRITTIADRTFNRWTSYRSGQASNLRYKLSKASEWTRQLNIYEDKAVIPLGKERLAKAFEIAIAKGFDFEPVTKPGEYHYTDTCSYKAGDIDMKLQVVPNIDIHGVASLDFSTYATNVGNARRAYRISVGKKVTITNNILNALVKT